METNCINILLVEDNPGDARLIREMLNHPSAGTFRVVGADRCSSALDCLARDTFDVLLLDLGLPDSQGLETIRKMRLGAPNIPIVILTGLADEEVGFKAVQEGAEDYLVKGQVNEILLTRSIQYSRERKRAEQALRESEEKYRLLFENAGVPIFSLTPEGGFSVLNSFAARYLGGKPEDFKGKTMWDLFPRELADSHVSEIRKVV